MKTVKAQKAIVTQSTKFILTYHKIQFCYRHQSIVSYP